MGDHKRSLRFRNDSFDYKILEESTDRIYIEKQEEYYIKKFDTYNNGLNDTPEGKGYNHNSSSFTTLGYIYSPESRQKMSESAKKRWDNKELRKEKSIVSKSLWNNENYRNNQAGKRVGKRLRPPKIDDNTVDIIRQRFMSEKELCSNEIKDYNEKAKLKGWYSKTPEGHFSKKYCKHYNCTSTLLLKIITNKSRTKILPTLYK